MVYHIFQGSEIRLKYLNEDNGFSYGMTNCIFNYALHQVVYFETNNNLACSSFVDANLSIDIQPMPLSSLFHIRASQKSLWQLQVAMAALLYWKGHQVYGVVAHRLWKECLHCHQRRRQEILWKALLAKLQVSGPIFRNLDDYQVTDFKRRKFV